MESMGGKKKKIKMCEGSSLADMSSGVDSSKIGYNNHSGKIGRTHHHSQSRENINEAKQNQVTGPKNTVGTVMLFGVPIVSLVMDGKERLCLAQISSTLLKEFSYNEIHNRRVALGITCIQCTPVQLEILRRAGAMPVTSRRCGMITRREAERLCQSFLGDHAPPQLPENFAFEVYHECAWGCRGAFVPSRYNSSRAKCIRCTFCQLFFSPNKFIFHSHRLPDSRYVQPDAANFNSWRRHLKLCGDPPEDVEALNNLTSSPGMMTAQIVHAWEDVKAMFNGGTRKRLLAAHSIPSPTHNQQRSSRSSSTPSSGGTPTGSGSGSGSGGAHSHQNSAEKYHHSSPSMLVQTSSISSGSTSSNTSSSSSGNLHNNSNNNSNYPQVSSSSSINPRPGSNQLPSTPSFLPPQHMHNLHHSSEPILPSPPSVLHSPGIGLPGSPPRLDSIWNPGLSAAAAAAAAAVAASRSTTLPPLPFHPLSIPWFRRPLFPFSHPFGPTCKLFGENQIPPGSGTLSPGTESAPGTARGHPNGPVAPHVPPSINASAFKPVPGSRGAEQLFSWLNNNNNIVHSPGGIIYPPCIPEDLSLGSGNGDLHAHSLIDAKNQGMRLPPGIHLHHHQFALDLNTTPVPDSSKENIHSASGVNVGEEHSQSNVPKGRSHSKRSRIIHQDSEDEETVDIESTEGEGNDPGNDPLTHWFQASRSLKRPLDEDDISLGIKQEVCKFEASRTGNGGGKKKRLWDCDRRVVKVKCSPGSREDRGGGIEPSPENLRFESNRSSPDNNNDTETNSGPSTPEILSLTGSVSYENRRSGAGSDGPILNILVTGFGPFRDHVVNASWESVLLLPNEDIRLPPNVKPGTRVNLIIYQLPVIYKYVADHMESLWQKYQPHLVIHVGVSGIATAITLEQYAHNSGYCSPDIAESTPQGSICVSGGCDTIQSGFDMKLVTATLNTTAETAGVVAEFSCDPGRYLCDFTYYRSLSIDSNRTAFIHVPPLNKPWCAEKMARAIRVCITEFIRQLQEKNLLDTCYRRPEFQDIQVRQQT